MRWVDRLADELYHYSKTVSRKGMDDWLTTELIKAEAGEVLNIGAGGQVARMLQSFQRLSVVSADFDANRKPDHVVDVCELDGVFGAESFDYVVMMEVLEHVPEPQRALQQIHRVLRPGGKVLLSTPFLFPIHEAPYDFYRYTQYGLKHLLSEYANVEIVARNTDLEAIAVLVFRLIKSDRVGMRRLGIALSCVIFVSMPLIRFLSRRIPVSQMPSGYLAIAQKPAKND